MVVTKTPCLPSSIFNPSSILSLRSGCQWSVVSEQWSVVSDPFVGCIVACVFRRPTFDLLLRPIVGCPRSLFCDLGNCPLSTDHCSLPSRPRQHALGPCPRQSLDQQQHKNQHRNTGRHPKPRECHGKR